MRTVLNALCAWALLLCCSDSALWARAQFQCSDSRAANFNGSIMNQFDPTLNSWQCLYPLIRPTPTKWQSMYVRSICFFSSSGVRIPVVRCCTFL